MEATVKYITREERRALINEMEAWKIYKVDASGEKSLPDNFILGDIVKNDTLLRVR